MIWFISLSTKMISAAYLVAPAPLPIEIPASANLTIGESFTPSPIAQII